LAEYRKILIVKPSSLGDVIMALPVLDALRKAYPHAHISWLLKPAYCPLLEGHPQLDEVLPFPLKEGWRAMWRFLQGIRRAAFDLVLDLQGLFRSGLVAGVSGAPVRVGFANAREMAPLFYNRRVPVRDPEMHAVDRYALTLAEAYAVRDDLSFQLPVDADALAVARDLVGIAHGRRILAIAPLSRRLTKNWPVERFGEVAALFAGEGWRIVVVGTPGQEDVVRQVAAAGHPQSVEFVGRPLKELVAVVSLADVWLSGDTGPLHIADALGIPTVSIYGSTSPGRTGPYCNRAGVIMSQEPCSPCFLRECPHVRCMSSISTQQVVDRIREVSAP
jgi:lipopolysaccharide heptosyltransferase I